MRSNKSNGTQITGLCCPVRRKCGRIKVAILAAGLLVLIEGCAGQLFRTQTETRMEFNSGTYRFTGVRKDAEKGTDDWQRIAEVLNRYGCSRCEDLEGVPEETIGSTATYGYTATLDWAPPVPSTHLDRLHTDLIALKLKKVEIGLERASVEALYRGLTAEGKLRILVQIAVSKGCRLFVDESQTGDFEERIVLGGEYSAYITIKEGQRWIFYYTELDVGRSEPLRRFFRLNIYSQREEELSREDFSKAVKGK